MARQLRVAVQMDPIEDLSIDSYSTFVLMLEAQGAATRCTTTKSRICRCARGLCPSRPEIMPQSVRPSNPWPIGGPTSKHYR
jgi:hypothetical protein